MMTFVADAACLPVGRAVALVDQSLCASLLEHAWHLGGNGYCYRWDRSSDKKVAVYLHREVIRLVEGICTAECVDHINGNPLDNRYSNLRLATKSQNMSNRGKTQANTSGFKGVSLHKPTGKWKAYIRKDCKQYYLGLFKTPQEAAAAYNRAARQLHGDFAHLNTI